jgi:predicted MPP superfamily phosphohydrolase
MKKCLKQAFSCKVQYIFIYTIIISLKNKMRSSRYIVVLIIITVSFLIDWYVFQGVKTLTSGWQDAFLRQIVHWAYRIFFTGFTALIVYTLQTWGGAHRSSTLTQGVINLTLTFFITKMVFIIVLFGEDIYRVLATIFNYGSSLAGKHNTHETLMPERRKLISQIGFLLAAIPFVSFMYGITKGKYRYVVRRHILYFEDLPDAFDGFRIAQISDIHSGSLKDKAAVQAGINLVKDQKPDLFVFTGDLVNNEAREIEPWLEHFSQIRAPYGQFSVLGNHDYGDYIAWRRPQDKATNLQQLKNYHASLGYRLLLDENVSIKKGGQQISLLGVENWGLGFGQRGNLNKAMAGVDRQAFKVLLSHDPSHWEKEVKNYPSRIHLTLSGHTHGMQMGIEVPGFRWSPIQYRYPNWAGLVSEKGRSLYVNRGFGFHGFSGRVGIWPEITVIELKKGSELPH